MYLILSRQQIVTNWDAIASDPANPRKDIQTPDEYIEAIEQGMTILGAQVVLSDRC